MPWRLQFTCDDLEIKEGKTYKLSFEAIAAKDMAVKVSIAGNVPDNRDPFWYGGVQTLAVEKGTFDRNNGEIVCTKIKSQLTLQDVFPCRNSV